MNQFWLLVILKLHLVALAEVPIPLITSRILFDGSTELMCLEGTFANLVDEKNEWPYLLAALRECKKPDEKEAQDKVNKAWRHISNSLLSKCLDYAEYKPIWLMLLGYINRLEIKLSETDRDDLLPRINCNKDYGEHLMDMAINLYEFKGLGNLITWNGLNDKQNYRLETISHTLRGRGDTSKWVFLLDLPEQYKEENLETRQSHELPNDFRNKFIEKVFERFSREEYFNQNPMEDPIQRIWSLTISEFTGHGSKFEPDPTYASEYAKFILFFNDNKKLDLGSRPNPDENMANRFIMHFLQRCSYRDAPDRLLQRTLLTNLNNVQNSICMSVRSEKMRKDLAIIASVPRFKQAYDVFEAFLRKNCPISLVESEKLTNDQIPIIGDMKSLRNFELLSEESRLPVNILSKLSTHPLTTLDPTETDFLKDRIGMARLFQRAENDQIPVLINALSYLQINYSDSLKEATRTAAFRNFVLRAFTNKKIRSLSDLKKLCGDAKNYCKNLIEGTMSDAVIKASYSKALVEWRGAMSELSTSLAGIIGGDCTNLRMYKCNQEFIKPDLHELQRAMNQMNDNDQLLTMKVIYTWITQKILEDSSEPKFVSMILKAVFYNSDYSRIKMLLEVAPTGLADQDGFVYAAWYVVHASSLPRSPIKLKSVENIRTIGSGPKEIPTFEDLCNSRCTVLGSKKEANFDLEQFRQYRENLERNPSSVTTIMLLYTRSLCFPSFFDSAKAIT